MDDLTAAPSAAMRRACRKAGPQIWALIRELYLSGVPAMELAVRFDVSVHTVRKRATREGWSRKAQAEAIPTLRLPPGAHFAAIPADEARQGSEAAEPEAEADPVEVARLLLRRAAGAAQAGRLARAAEGIKLAEGLARAARALGLDDEGADAGWGEVDEAELSPEALEALQEECIRRYSRYDRAPAADDAAARGAPDGALK